jgi:hypothetical protein
MTRRGGRRNGRTTDGLRGNCWRMMGRGGKRSHKIPDAFVTPGKTLRLQLMPERSNLNGASVQPLLKKRTVRFREERARAVPSIRQLLLLEIFVYRAWADLKLSGNL